MNLSKKTWHYRLAFFYADAQWLSVLETINICDYIYEVIKGFFRVLIGILLGGIVAACVADALIWLWVSLTTSQAIEPDVFGILGITIFSIFLLLAILLVVKILNELISSIIPKTAKFPSFITLAYHSFKHKMCFKIKFID